jgi:EAL domain-containing protein (putative c-di-GMP-specific phosphodiesterase class I)
MAKDWRPSPSGHPASAATVALDAPSRETVLVVDDNPSNVRLLERILARSGNIEVATCLEAGEAFNAFVASEPDLVLLDLHMPQMDGLEVMARIRAAVPDGEFLPVIVVTADASRVARDRVLAAGAADFLTKPFDYTEVTLRVRNLLETRRLNLALRRHNRDLEMEVDRERRRLAMVEEARRTVVARVERVLHGDGVRIHFQPIVDLWSGKMEGVEALARFQETPARPPNLWLAEAEAVGMGVEAELSLVRHAVAAWGQLGARGYLAVNLSPAALCCPEASAVLGSVPRGVAVVELTEHVEVADYSQLLEVRARLQSAGIRLAIDDTGAGISSFQHVLRLHPDVIKLDRSLIQDLDSDPARRVLVRALMALSDTTGSEVVAEGIETMAELNALKGLGVRLGQGFLLGRPAPVLVPSPAAAAAAGQPAWSRSGP